MFYNLFQYVAVARPSFTDQFAPVEQKAHQLRSIGFFNCDIDMSTFDDPIEEMKEYE